MNNINICEADLKALKEKYQGENLDIALNKIKNGYPVQYLIGDVNFYGNTIKVNESVLIPRYETEYLVEKTINYLNKLEINNPKILDICTGSGCIGLTLKKEIPTSNVTMSDISSKALKVAKKNKNSLKLEANIIKSDIYSKIKENDYDCIISNPPYIMLDEELPKELDYEPSLALYSENKGTYHIERILKDAKEHLKDKYLIALEINEKSEKDLTTIVNKYFENSSYSFEKDLAGKTRYLFIYNKTE